ncbi:unnamed protein product [Orchesella dallaii]|uniref:Reverse transcriptase domain-containing protein n=1 Tax=Orchesella dallaii TaxID=48710 RepID=A0ABP1QV24_9HEXA
MKYVKQVITKWTWFSNEIAALCIQRHHLKLKRKDSSQANSDYQNLKNRINNMVITGRRKYLAAKFDGTKSSEEVWDVMNTMINFRHKSNVKVTKLVSVDGEPLELDEEICNEFAREFTVQSASSNVELCRNDLDSYTKTYIQLNGECKLDLTEQEVVNAIGQVKTCKDTKENVPKFTFKKFSEILAIPLRILFLCIFATQTVPENMKLAYGMPLYKGKGRKTQSVSYRAIFSFITRIFEAIIHSKLLYYVSDQLDSQQHGFVSKRSCDTAISKFS